MTKPSLTVDEIKTTAIIALFSDDVLFDELVLKGGNAIDIAYGAAWRSSLDLDFSMGSDFDSFDGLHQRIIRCLENTFLEKGVVAFDINMQEVPPGLTEDIRDFWGGYKVDFKLISQEQRNQFRNDPEAIRRRALPIHGDSRKFTIDISKHELRVDKQTADLRGYSIPVYSPRMIVCEKLRAICQQMKEYAAIVHRNHRPGTARARDFFDIYSVTENLSVQFGDTRFCDVLVATFQSKRVPLKLLESISDYREFHRPDFVSVTSTVRHGVEIQEFDFYFDYVVEKCRALQSLWMK